MVALTRYVLTDVVRSQRLVPPLMLLAAVMTVLYSSPPSSLLAEYAFTAVVLYALGAWVGLVTLNVEDDVQRDLTAVAAGALTRGVAAKLLAAHLVTVLAALVLTAAPVVLGRATGPIGLDPVIGLAAHLICGASGVALGAAFCRPAVRRPGWAALGVVAGLLLTVPLNRLVALPPILAVTRVLLNVEGWRVLLGPAAAALAFSAAAGLLTARLVAARS